MHQFLQWSRRAALRWGRIAVPMAFGVLSGTAQVTPRPPILCLTILHSMPPLRRSRMPPPLPKHLTLHHCNAPLKRCHLTSHT